MTRHPIAVFFDEIGARNASFLRHVCVSLLRGDAPGQEEPDVDDGKSDRDEGVIPLVQEQGQQERAQEYGLPLVHHLKARREVLVKQMGDRGWITKVTEIPLAESTWGDAHSWWDPEEYMYEREEEESSDYYRERQAEWYRLGYADDGGPA